MAAVAELGSLGVMAMTTTSELILLHACFVGSVAFCASTIWGRMAERIYEARASSPRGVRWFLMSGELMKDRVRCVRFMRRLAWFQLVLGLAIYTLMLFSILSRR